MARLARGWTARIYDDNDPIRIELQIALAQGVLIIPVLVEGASMPKDTELPGSIKEFTYRNAVRMNSALDFISTSID